MAWTASSPSRWTPIWPVTPPGTIAQAVQFSSIVNRPNVYVKIPATPEGIPAIEEALYRGININITLIFSVDVHKQVMEAYLSALERRVEEGKPIDRLRSVASFFVSRVDTKVDKLLQALIDKETDPEKKAELACFTRHCCHQQQQNGLRGVPQGLRDRTLRATEGPRRTSAASPLGLYLHQEPCLQRRDVRGRTDRPRHSQHDARRDH